MSWLLHDQTRTYGTNLEEIKVVKPNIVNNKHAIFLQLLPDPARVVKLRKHKHNIIFQLR
jgi:hypothetical protein